MLLRREIRWKRIGSGRCRCRQLSWSVSYPCNRRWERLDGVCGWTSRSRTREWPPLDSRLWLLLLLLHRHAIICDGVAVPSRTIRLRSRVIKCELQPDLSSVLSLTRQSLPYIVCTSARNNDCTQIDECLSDEICFLVLAED
jgi:hypothetical protein